MTDPAVVECDLPELVDRARTLIGERRRLLGIIGPPGAGKSTLAARLVAALGPVAALVPMDGFHLPQAELVRLGRRDRMGAPDTFDVAGYVDLLARLRSGEQVNAPGFDRTIEEAVPEAIPVGADVPLVVTEGNYLLVDNGGWEAVAPLLDETWYLDVPWARRARRLVARRIKHGDSPRHARCWVRDVDGANSRIIEQTAVRADLVVRVPETTKVPAA